MKIISIYYFKNSLLSKMLDIKFFFNPSDMLGAIFLYIHADNYLETAVIKTLK